MTILVAALAGLLLAALAFVVVYAATALPCPRCGGEKVVVTSTGTMRCPTCGGGE